MPKYLSRAKRRDKAVDPASNSVSRLEGIDAETEFEEVNEILREAVDNASMAESDLQELHDELDEWYENLSEGLQQSSTGERLEEAKDQLDTAINSFSEAKDTIDGIENTEEEWKKDPSPIVDAILQAASELESAVDEANEVDFPGMYGR